MALFKAKAEVVKSDNSWVLAWRRRILAVPNMLALPAPVIQEWFSKDLGLVEKMSNQKSSVHGHLRSA
ncbi:hypothetical protein TCAL_15333 [Tigriopus californicus]|uniref:Uncharacterized protein n=1 Tax=Tigriopus californicus TaxID=6832 RepID=A0A553PKE7_TIGCA|nr:hypothetical protein TCAL_15333 [Tigriopus californicus]